MKNDFIKGLQVSNNLNKSRNIYNTHEKPKLKERITKEEINKAVQEMAQKIAIDYKDKPLAIICVERGANPFYELLLDNLHCFGIPSPITGTVKMTRGATKATDDLEVAQFCSESKTFRNENELKNVHVLIVDDQISSGTTFDFLKQHYSKALSVELATLIVKSAARNILPEIKYYSFIMPSRKIQKCWFWYGLQRKI